MPYALTIATPATRALVVEAMRGRADTLKRAATRAAADVEADRTDGRDVRARAVKLATMLAQAAQLESLATELEALEELALVESTPGLRLVPIPEPPPLSEAVEAARAELKAAGKRVTAKAVLDRLEAAPQPGADGARLLSPADNPNDPDAGVILEGPPPATDDDDGLSPEAHALADAAGLKPTVIEDRVTGALPEDDPAPEDVVDVDALLTAAPEGAAP